MDIWTIVLACAAILAALSLGYLIGYWQGRKTERGTLEDLKAAQAYFEDAKNRVEVANKLLAEAKELNESTGKELEETKELVRWLKEQE